MKLIKVLGSEKCSTCTKLKDKIAAMIEAQKLDASVEKITDIAQVMTYGVMSSPAVVIDEEVVCFGRVPSDEELENWLN
ncbi:MAG: thioredoxin family protein [Rickettsiales bacterium]|nr:thioredoxin family protein [Rickettsiales bacterium]